MQQSLSIQEHFPSVQFMAHHRRAVACDLCGQQFFPSSLPFHMKACVVKQQYVDVPCPHCDEPFRQCDLKLHIQRECKKKRKGIKNPSTSPTLGGGLNDCAVCGRRFAPDRLVKHQAICRRNSSEQKVPRDLVAAVEELAAPINSNWRAKRDEMKRRIGESKQNRRASASPPLEDVPFTLLLSQSKKPFLPNFHLVEKEEEREPTVLDDSLDELVEDPGREATAWTVEWPGTNVREKNQPRLLDPRARLEPVKFEFNRPLTRTSSSFTIPTTAATTPVFTRSYGKEEGTTIPTARGENYRFNHIPVPSIRFN